MTDDEYLDAKIRVGKYSGKKVREVEDYGYLWWIVNKAKSNAFNHAVTIGAQIKMKQIEHYGR